MIRRLARLSLGRLVAFFILLSAIPLAAFTYLTTTRAGDAVTAEVRARLRSTTAVSAVFIEREMKGVAELVSSYAERPSMVAALAGGPALYDRAEIRRHLQQLLGARRGMSAAGVIDPAGRLIDVLPPTPSIIGKDFSFRDWYRGVTTVRDPYISEVIIGQAVNSPRVSSVAALVHDSKDRVIGIVSAGFSTDAIQRFVVDVAKAQRVDLTVVDQAGHPVAEPGPAPAGLEARIDDPRVADALAGGFGVVEVDSPRGRVLSAYAPVPGIGWGVVAEIPRSQALGGLSRFRGTVLLLAAALGSVMAAGLVLLMLTLREQRRTELTLRESEELSRSIVEAASDPFVSMDSSGRITAWNSRAEQLFGWRRVEALGRQLADTIIPERYREAHRRGLARFLETGEGPVIGKRIEIEALRRDGTEVPVELAIWEVRSREGVVFNAFIRDITERKLAESAIAFARDRAMETSRLKSEFLANMSHEIRTPMNGVIGMAGLLLDTDLDPRQREYAEGVRSSAESLLGIINDILDFSKIEAGKLRLEIVDFDLRTAVEEVADLVAATAHRKGIELASFVGPDVPPAVRGDPGRLRQVLVNLAGNAVKFTERGEVVIRVGVVDDLGDSMVVRAEVSDTGIGMSREAQSTLFAPFSQADASTTRRYGGSGLGLAISNQLVTLMGGEIGVQSEEGRGSTFWFTVPLERGSVEGSAAPPRVADLRGLRVLIVDDNATNRTILNDQVSSWGMVAALAGGGGEALQMLRDAAARGEVPDLVLLDMHMPEMDGLMVAEAIASDPALRPAPRVLLTSSGDRVDAAEARRLGIAATLTKPVRQSQLFDCIAGVMGGAPARRLVTRHRPREQSVMSGHVLVAEDNPVNQKVAAHMLEQLGLRVDVVGNGGEAVDAVARVPYAAVFMDCQMPEMDGYEATRQIRRQEGTGLRTPIIAMTASAMSGDRERCLEAGMDDYVTKPVRPADVEAALKRWVRSPPEWGVDDSDDPIDRSRLESLQSLSDERTDIVAKLVGIFVEDATPRLAGLRRALVAKDAGRLREVAHSLKGSAANLGATALVKACERLEAAVSSGVGRDAPAALDRVEAEEERARAALRAYAGLGDASAGMAG